MKNGFARLIVASLAITGLTAAPQSRAADPYASAPSYAKPVAPSASFAPLITTGQQVQLTGAAPGTSFRFLGIPDGIGASLTGPGELTMFVNHEFTQTSGGAAGPLPSGARISEFKLGYGPGAALVLSAKDAIQRVFAGEPAVQVVTTATTPRFARFCSGYLGGPWSGLDTPIYFCGEETGGAATFDGQGGSAIALVNGDLYTLPRLGHSNWENIVVLPGTGNVTAVVGSEDAGTLTSQLYMYSGTKVTGDPDVLTRNGLRNGSLFVMAFTDVLNKNEATFLTKGTTTAVNWAPVNYAQNDAGLEAQAQAVGSFNFTRVEDICYDKTNPGVAYFVTTGSPGTTNPFGRLYKLTFDYVNPTNPGTLTLLLDGSEGMVSPDNIDVNAAGKLMICEDPNYNLAIAPLSLSRDTYLWEYDVQTALLRPVGEMDRAAAIAHALAADPLNTNVAASNLPGFWEFSGIIDASDWLGPNSWILDVQAHSLRINPSAATTEGGQVLVLTFPQITPTIGQLRLTGSVVNGRVRLRWSAGDRSSVNGFDVERSDSRDGEYTLLTTEMLSTGVDAFEDQPEAGTWYYRVVSHSALRNTVSDPFVAVVRAPLATVEFAAPSPNPSSAGQTLSFRLGGGLVGTPVQLSLFDASGRLVKTLYQGAPTSETVSVVWDGRDDQGHAVQGLFFGRLRTIQGTQIRRIIRVQ